MRDILRKNLKNPVLTLENAAHEVSERHAGKLASDFLSGVPFGYLLKMSEFYHHQYYINQNVLIPRPETEYLVDLIVGEFQGKVQRVLDVGTGSGVILLSLLSHNVGEKGIGADLSEGALEVAAINARRLRLADRVQLLKSDRLQSVEGTFDLIVSNPPYIRSIAQRNLVHASVDKHEPHEALYLPDADYDRWFEEFFKEIRSHLKRTFFMEGHELEVEKQADVLVSLGFQNVQVLKDLTGVPRYIRAEFC